MSELDGLVADLRRAVLDARRKPLGQRRLVGAGAKIVIADLNGDLVVDGGDLGLLLSQFGGPGSGDFDGSGSVNGADLGIMLAAWGFCP